MHTSDVVAATSFPPRISVACVEGGECEIQQTSAPGTSTASATGSEHRAGASNPSVSGVNIAVSDASAAKTVKVSEFVTKIVKECVERERLAGCQLSAAARMLVAAAAFEEIPAVLARRTMRNMGRSVRSVSWCWAQLALLLQSGLSKEAFARLETIARTVTPIAPTAQPGWQVIAAGLDKRATYGDLSRWIEPLRQDRQQNDGWTVGDSICFEWLPSGLRALPETEYSIQMVLAAIELTRLINPRDALPWRNSKGLPLATALRKFWGPHMFGELLHILRAQYYPSPDISDDWLASCILHPATADADQLSSLYRKCFGVGFELPPQHLPPQHLPLQHLPLQHLPLQHLPLQHLPPQHLPLQHLPTRRLPPQRLPPQKTLFPETAAVTDVALEARTSFLLRQYTQERMPGAAEAASVAAATIQANVVQRRTAFLARVISECQSQESGLRDVKASELAELVSGWLQTALREVNGNGVVLVPVNFSMCSWRWLQLAGVMIEKMDGDRLQGMLSQAETVIPRPKNVGKQWYLACVLDALISRALLNVWLTDKFGLTEPGWFSPEVLYVEYFPHDNPVRLPITPNGERLVLAVCSLMRWLTLAEINYHQKFNKVATGLTLFPNKRNESAKQMQMELGQFLLSELVALWRDGMQAANIVTDCAYVGIMLTLARRPNVETRGAFIRWAKIGNGRRRMNPDHGDQPQKRSR
ncbi:hypothetical protein GNI_011940 [Gregarina niphandrodes]|uniref:Uncharacterized protein n=1 Tax=Gregarina niphandrodes TaxID=110365 RepID=A0A023BCL2_GRENI|nr:hypothetical protein GNI_011940 [Gregarina niphandrodes]EZG85285.1 hypothetical protein GNI_011940 [Gregarina niphandrodes]|eukprot:XP_011128836.1 hypothetical protein GNI_011940 [Gregarina niphandrodes]